MSNILPEPARVFYATHASGGHSVRLRISSKRVDVSLASAASMYLTFEDGTPATWTCTVIADAASPTFVLDTVASSVYVDHVITTGDLTAALIGAAKLSAVVTVAAQDYACDERILSVTA